ncbi:MAG: hypothetical protein RIK87_04175 [Fuerstiella sp.]
MLCQRCGQEPSRTQERYCGDCRKEVLRELLDAGYLDQRFEPEHSRSEDMAEDTFETKFGVLDPMEAEC